MAKSSKTPAPSPRPQGNAQNSTIPLSERKGMVTVAQNPNITTPPSKPASKGSGRFSNIGPNIAPKIPTKGKVGNGESGGKKE